MSKNKKLLSMVVLSGILTTSVVACSSGQSKGNPSPSVSPNSSAATTSPGKDLSKKISISSIAGTWSSPVYSPDGAGVKALNERYNIDFKPQFVPYDEYVNKLPVVMAAGGLPDLIGMETVDANFVKWAKQGAFLPLNEYIDKYPTLKAVPKSVWDAVTVDGKIYAIPNYFPDKYGKKPIIRKDWLDNLGLKMPTNYDELIKVATAFAKNDPDQNGKDDTYGIGLVNTSSGSITYGVPMGAAWDGGWYHKYANNQYIPGIISPGFKKQIEVLRELYAVGALNKDWTVSKIGDVRNDFFAGKYGIFYEQPYDISSTRFENLKKVNPKAELAVIPPFVQEDGKSGFLGLDGYYEMFALNSNIKSDADKIARILTMLDEFRAFIPVDKRTPDNEFFNWKNGGVDKGYTMINGYAVDKAGAQDLQPENYITNRGWAPNNEANEPEKLMQEPFTQAFIKNAVAALKGTKVYKNPLNRVHSELYDAKQSELLKKLNVHHVKMIVGQESMDNWEVAVKEYLSGGGQDIINDVNKLLKDANISGEWE
ncbi:extracellular solute-binding protein [Paenibacillus koleovorans]|uniref:extracellular solute-binding protein n=1 Tax=Paenibacillus koleovorans TaxID=121608 RepID=UPI000FDC255C|nr:extracellular solute-binding protein [Paenibacillus koleovorans]